MIRGMTSNGHARSMPRPSEYTVNVMPIVRMSAVAADCRLTQLVDAEPVEQLTSTSGAAGRGSPPSCR